MDWHTKTIEETLSLLDSNTEGLNTGIGSIVPPGFTTI